MPTSSSLSASAESPACGFNQAGHCCRVGRIGFEGSCVVGVSNLGGVLATSDGRCAQERIDVSTIELENTLIAASCIIKLPLWPRGRRKPRQVAASASRFARKAECILWRQFCFGSEFWLGGCVDEARSVWGLAEVEAAADALVSAKRDYRRREFADPGAVCRIWVIL